MADISQLIKSSGIDLERSATQAFGAAVEDFAVQPLNNALRSVLGGDQAPTDYTADGSWRSTSYAASLANSQFRPKFKFLFRVEFLFKPTVLRNFGIEGAKWKNNFTFLIKSIDRPKFDFEYEEVNQYNFRTKILKSIKHKDLSMSFIDDVGNNVHEFFKFMMMVHSPITRRSVGASPEISDAYTSMGGGNGMVFSDNLGNTTDFAHRGAIGSDVGNAIQAIKITQMFVQPGGNKSDNGAKEVSFFFINPRIVSFDLDRLDHELSEISMCDMAFDFDYLVMGDVLSLQALPSEKALPPVGSAPGDIAPTGRDAGGKGNTGGADPYTKILSSIGARAAQKITNDVIGSQLRRIPGLGQVADTLTGLVEGITRDAITGVGERVNQAFARPDREVISDSNVAGPVQGEYQTSTGSFGTDQPTPTFDDTGIEI